MDVFQIILFQPILNALIFIYQCLAWHDLGIAIILLTLFIRCLLYPLMAESIRVQTVTAKIQPKIREIQEKYKNDKEKQAALLMALWKDHKINPFSGLILMLIQLPILVALYQVLAKNISPNGPLVGLYSFIPNPGVINTTFLGIVNLAGTSLWLAVLTGVFQFIQAKMVTFNTSATSPTRKNTPTDAIEQMATVQNKLLLYVLPAFTVFICLKLPAALALYWITSTLFSIVQQYVVLRKLRPVAA